MYKAQAGIEAALLEEQAALYRCIKDKSTGELGLPVCVTSTFVGFGKLLDFYMFWLCRKGGRLCFKARRNFFRQRTDNFVVIPFLEENKEAILNAIDEIYNSYQKAKEGGRLDEMAQRERDKIEGRAISAAGERAPSAAWLLWNDVTVAVLEKREAPRDLPLDDPEYRARLSAVGQMLIEAAESAFSVLEGLGRSQARRLAVYREYMATDKTTLADVAAHYGVSRERIRQIVVRVEGFIFRYFKKTLLSENEAFGKAIEQLAAALQSVDYNVIDIFAYGLNETGQRKKQAILKMLFGTAFSLEATEEIKELSKEEKERESIAKERRKALESWNFYRTKICFPSAFSVADTTPVVSYKKGFSFSYEKNLCQKLKQFSSMVEIVENPDIVYYTTLKTNHRPHFLLRLPDGRRALVVVMPVLNMAFIYNIDRCNALHRFCKENGYGYLIIDDRGNSIYDVKAGVVDAALKERLDGVLHEKGRIGWKDIKEIKESLPLSNIAIAAYVMQNRLHFTMNPFCISRKRL